MSESAEQNVLFVVLDTVRKDHLTVYGHDEPTTPALERFAEEATVFEQAVAPAPWTLPVHASMFTGVYPNKHGATQESPYLEGIPTLAESLSAAGYDTACYSSNAWISPYTNLTEGFDDQDNFFAAMPGGLLSGPLSKIWKYFTESDSLRRVADWFVRFGNIIYEFFASQGTDDSKTPAVIDRTQQFIEDSEGPFFGFINLMDAHMPYHPPEEQAEQFAPGVDSTAVCQDAKKYNAGGVDIDDEEWEDIRNLYDACIRHADDNLGRLFTWLKDNDHWEDTTVVVCADHGELHGEHGLYGHEFNIYEPLVNVPLLVKHADLEPGRREDQVELLDLYHTLLDATGVEPLGTPVDETRSLLSASYREFAQGEYAFVEYHDPAIERSNLETKAKAAGVTIEEDSRFYSRMRASRTPAAKYIRNERIPDEAYRLDEAGETENLLGSDDPAVDAVEDALEAFESGVGGEWKDDGAREDVLADADDEVKDRLSELGYVE